MTLSDEPLSTERDEATASADGQASPPTEPDKPDHLGVAATEEFDKKERKRRRRASTRTDAASEFDDRGLELVVFEPNAALGVSFRDYVASVWERRQFILVMAQTDIRQRRSNTSMGALWDILDPMFQAAIYYMLFTIIRSGARPVDFVHVLFGSILLFQATSVAMTAGGSSLQSGSGLMLNSSFPRAVLPLSAVMKALLSLKYGVVVFLALQLIFAGLPTLEWLWFPVFFVINIVLMVGMALLAATLQVLVKDVKNLMTYITRLFFFTTPILYPLDIVPERLVDIMQWQPIFALFANYQEMMAGNPISLFWVAISVGWALLLLVVGTVMFLRHEREFASRL